MFNKILVPVDGSSTSARGLDEAIALAKVSGGSLVLMYVIDAYPMAGEMMSANTWQLVIDGLRQAGHELLDRGCARAAAAGVAARPHLVELPPLGVADAILDAARHEGCDLVVMGTHGRTGVRHLLLGSNAERVVKLSSMPVLLVRSPSADAA